METRARLWAPPQRLWQHWRGDAPSEPVILGLVSSEEQCQAVPWMSGLASEDFSKCTMGVRGTPALPRYAHAYALQNRKPRLQTFRKGYEVTVYGCYKKKWHTTALSLGYAAAKAPVLLPCSSLAQSIKLQQFLRNTGIPMAQTSSSYRLCNFDEGISPYTYFLQ